MNMKKSRPERGSSPVSVPTVQRRLLPIEGIPESVDVFLQWERLEEKKKVELKKKEKYRRKRKSASPERMKELGQMKTLTMKEGEEYTGWCSQTIVKRINEEDCPIKAKKSGGNGGMWIIDRESVDAFFTAEEDAVVEEIAEDFGLSGRNR